MSSRVDGDLVVSGNFKAGSMQLPANSVGNGQADAANPIGADKLIHQHRKQYSQKHGTAVVTERMPIHIAWGAGTLYAFRANLRVACVGAATVVVDLYKNGATILSTTCDFSNADAITVIKEATFSNTAYAADDIFEVVVTATAGGGTLGQGLGADLVLREAAD